MDDDFFRHELDGRGNRDNLFLWTVFILVLVGAALISWLGSFYVFGHPEKPRSYRLLQKLKKIDPPKRFELTAAPPGEFLSPQKFFQKYSTFTKLQLQKENDELLRNYINNFRETKKLVPYVIGSFNILATFELDAQDLFPSGVAALAQAIDFPQVVVEHVYPAAAENVPVLKKMLVTGLDIKLEKTLDLSAVIHIERIYDGRLQVTVVPLLYGRYALKKGSGGFSLEPPSELRLERGAPIVRAERLQEAFKTYAAHRTRNAPTATGGGDAPVKAPSPELVRVDPIPEPPESMAPAPAATVAAANPVAPVPAAPLKGTAPAVKPRGEPPPQTATPPRTTAVAANTVPAPSPPPVKNVPLQPFIASAPPRNTATTSEGTWPTYQPGKMPRGKVVNLPEAVELADRDVGGEKIYLRGQFVVTAPGENRAVLRSRVSEGSRVPADKARIIVEFPAGAVAPAEGALYARDETRPFEIRDVQRGADGSINIYVREIIAP